MLRNKYEKFNESIENSTQCKICLENSLENTLISPCKCTGSMKYVHEKCLKKWIIIKQIDIAKAACEVCETSYSQSYKIHQTFQCQSRKEHGKQHWLIIPLLCSLQAIIFLLVFRVLEKLTDTNDEIAKIFSIILFILCSVSTCVIIFISYKIIKQSCTVKTLKDWEVYEYKDETELHVQENHIEEHPENIFLEKFSNTQKIPKTAFVNGLLILSPNFDEVFKKKPEGKVFEDFKETSDKICKTERVFTYSESPADLKEMECFCFSRCCLCHKEQSVKLNTGELHGMCFIHRPQYSVGENVTCIHCNFACEINVGVVVSQKPAIDIEMINKKINEEHPDEIRGLLGNVFKFNENLVFSVEVRRKCIECRKRENIYNVNNCEYHLVCNVCYDRFENEQCTYCEQLICMQCEELCLPIIQDCRHEFCENCLEKLDICPLCQKQYGTAVVLKKLVNCVNSTSYFSWFTNCKIPRFFN